MPHLTALLPHISSARGRQSRQVHLTTRGTLLTLLNFTNKRHCENDFTSCIWSSFIGLEWHCWMPIKHVLFVDNRAFLSLKFWRPSYGVLTHSVSPIVVWRPQDLLNPEWKSTVENKMSALNESSSTPVQLSFPLPKAPETKVHVHLTVNSTSLLLFLTTISGGNPSSGAALGSFVYALPDVRFSLWS